MADFPLDIDWLSTATTTATTKWLNVVPGYGQGNDGFTAAIANPSSKGFNLPFVATPWSGQRWNGGTTYYKMQGMDQSTNGLYATWVVTGTPDYSAASYTGPLNRPLRDVHVVDTWIT